MTSSPANTLSPSLQRGTREGQGLDGGYWGVGCASWAVLRHFGSPHPNFWPLPTPPGLPRCQPFCPCEGHSPALPPPQLQRGEGGDLRERAGQDRDRWEHEKRQKVHPQGSGLQRGKGHPHPQPTLERFIMGRVRFFFLFSLFWPISTSSAF